MKSHYYPLALLLFAACAGEPETPSNPESATGTNSEAEETLWKQATSLFAALPAVAENPENAVTDAKVALGKALYFETRLSKDGHLSCNTCHNLATFGVDNLPTSPGDNGSLGNRNSPTVLNAALHFVQFWDGRAKDVEEQAGGPVLNPAEMAMPNRASVVKRLKGVDAYKTMFAAAFPGEKDPITYGNMEKAIGAFERTLLTPSRWDAYLEGDKNQLTADEKAGLKTFIEQGCITCHTGTNLGGNMYQKFGLMNPYWEHTGSKIIDEGRYQVTKMESDKYIFKVPSLRNVTKTQPYFHDGSVADLGKAVKIMGKTQLNKDLTDQQVKSIVTFLNALTGSVPAVALTDAS